MASTIPENDRLEVPAGNTVGGREFVIVPTQTGLYKIEVRGPGGAHPIEEQLFTSLTLAQRALEAYRRANAAAYAKEAMKQKIISNPSSKEQRRQEAMLLKNGELSVPEEEEE